ncbi:MAG: putative collagen-binding domain-containing protein, partial [Phycisphaerae bacterium]|nr:putative collagen-binding domain-containing protein [Phycisphaerae bacterium]
WSYVVSFVKGKQVAVSDAAGTTIKGFDAKSGSFVVKASDKTGRDLRGKGRLQYVGKHHLRFAGSGEYFLKCGADAPENFLAYQDFDGSFKNDGQKDNLVKSWNPHVKNWRKGDPTWQGGKGKGIIGAINYLASEGLNAFSFITMNIGGDDRNVFPYTTYRDRTHLDCSRLDQWEMVFAHGERMGMYLHFKTMETENELLLDRGDLGPLRTLYYRELIARFAHHMALNWNLGEEINNASHAQKVAWANYFRTHDPYRHNIVIHNMGDPHYDLLGKASALTGFSLQTNRPDFSQVHKRTLDYIKRSAAAGKPWVVACDEPGDATHSLRPDNDAGASHTDGRKNALWGHIMAGGAGLEFYFGYKHAHSDLTCQDYRSRDKFWDYCRFALEFFKDNKVPFWEMTSADDLLDSGKKGSARHCLAQTGKLYLVYLPSGGPVKLDLSKAKGPFTVQWFNPRKGGKLQTGSVRQVTGGKKVDIGRPPADKNEDWLAVIRRS